MLGIGIPTRNRLDSLGRTINGIRTYTETPYCLQVFDDGSTDGTQLMPGVLRARSHIGYHRNFNRLLYWFASRGYDPIIIVEDDTWPIERGWEREWIDAARRWTHVNYSKHSIAGAGTAFDPLRCRTWGCQVCATTLAGIREVGYFDPRFFPSKYGVGHADWTFRFERLLGWKKFAEFSTPPCLSCGVASDAGIVGSDSLMQDDLQLSHRIFTDVNRDTSIFRPPWLSEQDREIITAPHRDFTVDWTSRHTDLWRDLLAPLAGKPHLSFLEIGSFEGRTACWLLENILTDPTSRLTCVDPWDGSYFGDSAAEARFEMNTGDASKVGQVQKLKGPSRKMLAEIPDGSLDFAYIDGFHEGRDPFGEAWLLMPLLKRGGLFVFDDYEINGTELGHHHSPRAGIDSFLALSDFDVEVIHRGYQIVARKK